MKTLAEIGMALGLSSERVRQIEVEALDKLRRELRRRGMTADDLRFDYEFEPQSAHQRFMEAIDHVNP